MAHSGLLYISERLRGPGKTSPSLPSTGLAAYASLLETFSEN